MQEDKFTGKKVCILGDRQIHFRDIAECKDLIRRLVCFRFLHLYMCLLTPILIFNPPSGHLHSAGVTTPSGVHLRRGRVKWIDA
jgi:hypothetical protein